MFRGKRVFITGGSKGLGRALSLQIAKEGAEILTVARTESQLQSLQQEVQNNGGTLSYKTADITKEETLNEIIDWIYETGGIEMMVHNAGYLPQTISPKLNFNGLSKNIIFEYDNTFILNRTMAKKI